MRLKQWEIYNFPYPSEKLFHPCVVISNQTLVDNEDYEFINCLLCVSVRADFELKHFHVRLNGADGLDGPTVVKCNEIFHFEKTTAGDFRGAVTSVRKDHIKAKIIEIFGLRPR